MKRKALGRGLSALIPDARSDSSGAGGDYFLCPIERISPSKGQPRRYFDQERLAELVTSIKEQGLVQPLVVRPARDGKSYKLVAGERRWRAAQKAGLHEVPVVIRRVDDLEAFELALVENLQREDLNPIEEAEAYKRLIEEHGTTQEQLAAKLGKDRSTVANSLRLLRLPDAVQRALVAGAISTGHARALLALERPKLTQRALRQVIDRELSVRETEAMVRKIQRGPATPATPPPSTEAKDLEQRLARALQTRVKLRARATGRGRIEIHYGSLDELDRLLEVLLR